MKITPSGLIDTLTQTSGGTTIQNSYGGLQLHKKAYQKKKKTVNQQTVRAAFTNVQSTWGSLSPTDQATWNAATDPGVSGFQLYSATNNALVNAGSTIINEYATPTTDPINDLTFFSEAFNFASHPYTYELTLTSILNLIPTSGWNPYVKWTGWILGSQYRYPAARFTVPQAAFEALTTNFISFTIDESMSSSFRNFNENCKAQFIIGLINTTTGQTFEYLTYEAISS
jgi:hypothetical protein